VAEDRGEHRLPNAGRPDQQGVRALFDEAQRCGIFDQAAVEVRRGGEVELLERLARRLLPHLRAGHPSV
jgi:hypothetical protein